MAVPIHNGSLGGNEYVAGLDGLHQAFSLALGRPVYAPIDISTSGLKILDSGCNTGTHIPSSSVIKEKQRSQSTSAGRWLFDLASTCSPSNHEYVGTDVWTEVFPGNPPPNFQFHEQDICKPWPESWYGTFDLVHQRTVLVNARKIPIKCLIAQMVELLKPGGWIQLMEGDFTPVQQNGPAMREFLELGKWFFDEAGPGSDMGPRLESELSSIGLKSVQEATVMVGTGAVLKEKSQIPEIVDGSIEGLCAAIPGSLINLRGTSNVTSPQIGPLKAETRFRYGPPILVRTVEYLGRAPT